MSTSFEPDFRMLLGDRAATIEEYGRFQQHLILLEDRRRISAFAHAIDKCEPSGVVVDVGAGTGILALMALKRGWDQAFLIEPSRKICAYAAHLARANGLDHKITILMTDAEHLDLRLLPEKINLLISESLSSLLFGFGTWDTLGKLAAMVAHPNNVIPRAGRLYAALSIRDYSSRPDHACGLQFLKQLGLTVDLPERTFRSGGNVFSKGDVHRDLRDGILLPRCIASFDLLQSEPIELNGQALRLPANTIPKGLVLFWVVDLTSGTDPVQLSSLDAELTSWYPYYVPFSSDFCLSERDSMHIRMSLVPKDNPYKYAIQFLGECGAVTHLLYW